MKKREDLFGILRIVLVVAVLSVLASGCAKNKTSSEMNFDELKTKALAEVSSKKSERAVEYLEQLVSRFPESHDISEYKLMLSDLYLKAGNLQAAHELYQNYTTLYPGDAKAEYAAYKSILTKFYQTLKVSKMCDQSDTEHALSLCKSYFNNPLFDEYTADIKDIYYTCEHRLIDKEVYVFNSYLRRNKFQSAKNRIDYLRTTFLRNHKSLEPQILFLECKLAHKQKENDLVKSKVDTLMKKHNDSQFTRMAMGMLNKKPSKFRFI